MGVREIERFLKQWRMEVKDLRRRMILAPTPRERKRWYAMLPLAQGWTASATAEALERDPHTIGRWASFSGGINMAHSNHSVLGEGLRLYTNAMGRFVKQRLEAAFGDTWWEEAVIKTRSYVRWRQLEHDMAKDPRADKVTFLDPGTFVAIIDRNHAVFQDIFPNRREVQSLLVQVSEARNRWAHSLASSDLADDDLVRALMSMEKLLSDAGLPEVWEVEKLRKQEMEMSQPTPRQQVSSSTEKPGSRVHNEEPESRPRADLAEVVRQEVIDHWFTPARSQGESEVTVAARDVNRRLGWSQRFPSICGALTDKSGKLARQANIELIRITGPNPGATTEFVYRLL